MCQRLYEKVAKCLLIRSIHSSELDLNETEDVNLNTFYNKYRRNFFINKNTANPKYKLKDSKGELDRFDDGTPKIIVNVYHRPTRTDCFKILLPSLLN